MDPGTIVGIVSLTLQVSRLMYKTAEAIGSAGEDVRLKAIEVDSFTKTVKAVQQALEEPPAIPPSLLRLRAKIEDTIADIIDNYNKALDPLKKLLDIFNPLVVRFAEQRRKLRALGHMIYFSLKRNDVQKYCQALQTSSGSLNLSLSALIALQTRDANGLKGMAIQVQYISGTLEPVLSARPDQHQLEDVPPSFLGSLQSMNTNADSDKVVEEGGDDSKDTQEGKPSSSEVQDNQLTVVSQVSGDLIRYRSREGDEGLSQEEINSIKYQVDGVLNDEGIMPANDVLAVTKSLGRKLQEFAKVANTAPTTTEENLDNQPPQSGFNSARDRSPEPSQVSVDGAQLRGPAQRKNPELLEAIKFRDWEGTVHPLPFEEVLNFEVSIQSSEDYGSGHPIVSLGDLLADWVVDWRRILKVS